MGAIAGRDGVIISQCEVGSTNHHSNPMDVVKANLDTLIANLLGAAKAKAEDVVCICLGMAGVDRPEDKPLIKGLIAEFLPKAECIPVNDAVIALTGGASKPVGIIVIAGTGSIAFGFDEEGTRCRAGGWGHILGDEGSGYMLGLRAMRAVMRAYDQRTQPTKLHEIVLGHFGFDRPEQLLGWTKEVQGSKAEIGALSRLVFTACEQGDEIAWRIVREEAAELASCAQAVAKRLFPGRNDIEIVVGGGNLRKSPIYFQAFQDEVDKVLPGVNAIRPRKEPVEGAVIYAMAMHGKGVA